MIRVDSSDWIDHFTGTDKRKTEVLDAKLGEEDVVAESSRDEVCRFEEESSTIR